MSILKIWNEGQVYCCYRIRRGKRSLIIWELIRAYKHAAISQTSVPKVIFHCFPGANDSIIFYWRGRTGNISKIKQSTKQNMTLKLFILQWKIWGEKSTFGSSVPALTVCISNGKIIEDCKEKQNKLISMGYVMYPLIGNSKRRVQILTYFTYSMILFPQSVSELSCYLAPFPRMRCIYINNK